MSDHVYKRVEIAGSSPKSIEDAIENAIARTSKSLDLVEWFEVVETRGHIENGKVAHYQVVLKVGFRMKDV
ncbi:dodecin [Hydrocarboniclastica marina]|uniref:Dodecin flavoprotein n=1 Tax=Hydrocarboniclastica marina TaxID=2259620 RepID=A0A4P7XEL1_9ALTE|nr:dodecin [Hydrocarboniclastica marina]MAL99683.1 dodecin flavoprotein [Alteromonadaceae bacterium]QCF25338.1 dodecin flavoprotein [Hydrocarboniclastica marina]